MDIERIESFKQFAKHLEYPIVLFEAESGKVLDINYEAQILLGGQIESIHITAGKTASQSDLMEAFHWKKSLMLHRLNLIADGKEFLVCGLLNETVEEGKTIYMLMFELRSGMSFGSMTLERIVDHAGMVALHVDMTGEETRARYVTKNISRYGYTRAQLYENIFAVTDIICPEDMERMHEALENAARKHMEEQTLECRILTEGRELIPVRMLFHYIYDREGNLTDMEVLWFDLKEEFQRNSENAYLSNAVSKMKSVVLVKSYREGKRTLKYISPNAGMVGMNVEALKNGDKLTEDYIHPEDRDGVIDAIYQAVKNGVTDYSQTYRMVRDDGKKIWVENEITVNRMSDGEAEISFLLTDITEFKNMENELAVAEEEKRAAVSEQDQTGRPVERVTIDRNDTELLQQLQLMAEALSQSADYYCVVMDTEGRFLTAPVGPVDHMGQFYDLYERPQVKEKFQETTEQMIGECVPRSVRVSVDGMDISLICAPLVLENRVMAFWTLVSFEENGADRISSMIDRQWHLANSIVKYYYAEEVSRREIRARKLVEMQLYKEKKERHVIHDMVDTVFQQGKGAFGELCQKAGLQLSVTDIGVYIENKEKENVEKYFIWNYVDEENPYLDTLEFTVSEKQKLKECLEDKNMLVIDKKSSDPFLAGVIKRINMESVMIMKLTSLSGAQGYVIFADSVKPHQFGEKEGFFASCVVHMFENIIENNEKAVTTEVIPEGAFEAYNHVRDAVFVKDNRSGEIIFSNKALDKLFGYSLMGTQANEIVYDQLDQYRSIQGIRKRFIANKKVTKWQSYMKELDQVMNITMVDLEMLTGKAYSLFVLKKNKNK